MDETKIDNLGPYEVSDINDDILGDVVYNNEVPVIIKQTLNNKTIYAVLAKNKDIRIACVGCFKRDMRITDTTRCKKCASFVKHWDTKDGERRLQCKNSDLNIEAVAANCRPVTMDFAVKSSQTLEEINTSDLIAELKKRGDVSKALKEATDRDIFTEVKTRDLEQDIAEDMDDDALLFATKARGIWPIFEARPTRLIHELRRQARNVTIEDYYHDGKKGAMPHSSDKIGADVLETVTRETRQAKKRKIDKVHFEPKSVTDFT